MTYNTTVPYSIVVEKPSSWFQRIIMFMDILWKLIISLMRFNMS